MRRPITPSLPCICATFRRASRTLTQFYERALRPTGLRATQFTVLQTLSLAGEVTQRRLGQILAMDSTTLTRTLTIMSRQGWIAKQRGEDRREWRMRLSRPGEVQFKRALPYWEKAQTELRRELGSELSDNLMKLTQTMTRALIEAEPKGESI
jgi:DNA-binding MarR family transcriptional regulator